MSTNTSSSRTLTYPPPTSLPELAEYLKTTCEREANPKTTHGLTILITGASSGIGLEAAKLFALINPVNRLILAARDEKSANFAKEQVEAELQKFSKIKFQSDEELQQDRLVDWTENIIPLACDHSSLDSVRQFNERLRLRLMETYRGHKWALNGIDVLCLNAAILTAKDSKAQYTVDGNELTLQTNHLSPFLLTNLIQDLITPGGRVVVTTSGLYNFEKLNNMRGLERMAYDRRSGMSRNTGYENARNRSCFTTKTSTCTEETECSDSSSRSPSPSAPSDDDICYDSSSFLSSSDMIDGSHFHFKRSYALSKLCNVAFCIELNNRLQARNNNTFATCFSPGLITKTGLFRYQDPSEKDWHENPAVLKKEKSVLWGAGALVYMSIADEVARVGGAAYWSDSHSWEASKSIYGQEFSHAPIPESEVSQEQAKTLWKLTSQLVQSNR